MQINAHILQQAIEDEARSQGTTNQAALRDLLTDLRHAAERLRLNFKEATIGSYDVFRQEIKLPCRSCGNVVDGVDEGIDCFGCGGRFCDNCYDTTKGDGCHCHPLVKGSKGN